MIARLLRAIVITIATLACATASFADDDLPLIEDVERRMVAVRVLDLAVSDVIAYGSGTIIGERGGEFFITTARHVVTPSDMKEGEFAIEVRFFRRDEWIRIKALPKMSPTRDLAVLIAPVKFSPYEPETLDSTLPVAAMDSETKLKDVTIFGLDVEDKRTIRQSNGRISGIDGERITFDADAVRPGWSGGIVVNEVGVVGMIVTEGSGRQGHQALAFTALLEDLQAMDVPMQVRTEPLLQALAAAQRNGLTLGLFVWDETASSKLVGEWAAVRITSQQGLRFGGDLLTARMGGEACWLETRGSELLVGFPARLAWRNAQQNPNDAAVFSPTNEAPARGVMTLKSVVGRYSAYLAIPTGRSEMLASSMIARGASNDWRECTLSPEIMQAFNLQSQPTNMVFDGARPAFPLEFPRVGTMWPVTLGEHAGEATLRMVLRVADGATRLRDRDRPVYDSLRIALKDADGKQEISHKRVRADGNRSANWVTRVPQRFSLWFEGEPSGSLQVPVVIEAAVIEYGE